MQPVASIANGTFTISDVEPARPAGRVHTDVEHHVKRDECHGEHEESTLTSVTDQLDGWPGA